MANARIGETLMLLARYAEAGFRGRASAEGLLVRARAWAEKHDVRVVLSEGEAT